MKNVLVFIILGVVFVTYGQEIQDCKRFKFGKYEIDNLDGTTSIIIRKGKFQYEVSDGVKVKDRIEWIDNCSYKLISEKIKTKPNTIYEDVLYLSIIQTLEHAYVVRITDKKSFEVDAKLYEFGYLNYDVNK